MADYFIKAEYALSSRSTCRGCNEKIEKSVLRIALVVDIDQQYHSEKWHHIGCLSSLPPKFRALQKEAIYGLDAIKSNDATLVSNLIETLKLGGNKKKQSKKEKIESKKKSKVKTKAKDEEKLQEVQDDSMEIENPKKVGRRLKKATLEKGKEEDSQDSEDEEEDQQKVEYIGYSEEERKNFESYLNKYNKMNTNQLKQLLKTNDQTCTGTKAELVERCADGKTLGSIPRCPRCGGGRPKFNNKLGVYKCPGYMEDTDFIRCQKQYKLNEITRNDWKDEDE